MELEIKSTADGSKTLFAPDLNEHYHSTFGAVQESMHVFISAGLNEINKPQIRVFEMGFGTGLNALLTCINSSQFSSIEYHSIELFPLDIEIALKMGYCSFLKLSNEKKEIYNKILTCPWDSHTEVTPYFKLKKIKGSISEYSLTGQYDLVYYDAFAPSVQPELWTGDIFRKIYESMNEGGIMVTYCAKGDVRRAMQHCGFIVERLPGPPGKIHMLRAIKKK